MLGRAGPPPFPHPQLFNPLENFQIKQTNTTAFCLETLACSKSIFIKLGRREGKEALEKQLCAGAERQREERQALWFPCPIPALLWCPGAAGVRASAAAAIQQRTFLCEAAVPHHANALTKRRRYYGKDFSASYSRVRDSTAGRAGSSLGIRWEPASASAPYLATAWGWQSTAGAAPGAPWVPLPADPTAGI